MRYGLVYPWLSDTYYKIDRKYNKGKSLSSIRYIENMKRNLWYKNLKSLYEQADLESIKEGIDWYNNASKICDEISEQFNVETSTVAQVIAALSPAAKWERNVFDAKKLIENYYHRGWAGAKSTKVVTYGPNKSKAIEILLGKKTLNLNNGLKTYNFFNNILNPSDPNFVTIDRHAFNILNGNKKRGAITISKKQYRKAMDVYKFLAKEKGLTPNQLQAITWVKFRKDLNET